MNIDRSGLRRRNQAAQVRHSQAKSGFTLVELLVSVVILSIGIVAILHALERSLFALGSARDHMWADLLMKEKITEMKIASLEEGEEPESGGGDFDEPYDAFSWDTSVDDYPIPENSESVTNRLVSIDLKVWRRGVKREFSTSTFLTQ